MKLFIWICFYFLVIQKYIAYPQTDSIGKHKKISVGIFPFYNTTGQNEHKVLAEIIPGKIEAFLGESKNLEFFAHADITHILKEKGIGPQVPINETFAVKIGRECRCDVVILGRIDEIGGIVRIRIRLVNAENGRLIIDRASSFYSINEFDHALLQMCRFFLKDLTGEKIFRKVNLPTYFGFQPELNGGAGCGMDALVTGHEVNPAGLTGVPMPYLEVHTSLPAYFKGLSYPQNSMVTIRQPLLSNTGLKLTYPINSLVWFGISATQLCPFPYYSNSGYELLYKGIMLTIPMSMAVNSILSLGAAYHLSIWEYDYQYPGEPAQIGDINSNEFTLGGRLKINKLFNIGATLRTTIKNNGREGGQLLYNEQDSLFEGSNPSVITIGAALQPLSWLQAAADAQYEIRSRIRSTLGFKSGIQINFPEIITDWRYYRFGTALGYVHTPEDKLHNNNPRYLVTGFVLNSMNLFVKCTYYFQINNGLTREIKLGSIEKSVQVFDYKLNRTLISLGLYL
ncbi:MAG: hypothetical protein ABIA63_10140 [bacterium]